MLKSGTFSNETLSPTYVPLSYMVTHHWESLLEHSAKEHGETHVHLLHLGIIAAERLDVERALDLFTRSIKLAPSAIAYRCLAALGLDATASWGHYQSAWKLALQAKSDNANDLKRAVDLQRQLLGEMALFATTVSMLTDHNLTFNNRTVSQSMWAAVEDLVGTMVPATPGCHGRGVYCDHDMVAFAVMHREYQRGTVDGCKHVLETLKTWPFITDAGDSYVFSRKPHLQPHYSPTPGDQDTSWWTQCLIKVETQRVGHQLSPTEITALVYIYILITVISFCLCRLFVIVDRSFVRTAVFALYKCRSSQTLCD